MTRLRNRITGQFSTDIRLLMMSLFQIYGKISANNLTDKFDNVATISYNIDETISVIFDAVDDLREISELANRPYTNQKMVDLGYIIVSKLPIFGRISDAGFDATQPTNSGKTSRTSLPQSIKNFDKQKHH